MNQVSSITVANYFINKSFSEGVPATPMKILKLVYIAHGWHLGFTDQPLIDEPAQAWQYGPVVPTLYHELKVYGKQNIDRLIPQLSNRNLEADQRVLLDKVWDVYKDFDGLQLSTLTHQEGTPWYITYHDKGGKNSGCIPIPNDLIKDHYKGKISKNRDRAAENA